MNSCPDASSAQTLVDSPKPSVSDHCAICLEAISERAITAPCNHALFDYLCLLTWLLEQDARCPLCKTEVTEVFHDFVSAKDFKTFRIPFKSIASQDRNPSVRSTRDRRPHTRRHTSTSPPPVDSALAFRKHVYRHQLYSLHIGANRISRFRNFTPKDFTSSPDMQSRAKKWIRRELRVFDFLINVEFLLEYIMAMLRTVDIKDSTGKPAHLLQEFLGRQHASLFLHELNQWLRSPYKEMSAWDDIVQYGDE